MKSKYLFSIAVLAAVLLAASWVGADECKTLPPLPSYASPVARSCTVYLSKDQTQYATILAGPDGNGGLATAFPKKCLNANGPNKTAATDPLCQCEEASSSCSQWQYQWTITSSSKANLSQALVSAGSNVSVYSSDPAGAAVLQPNIALGERLLQFNVNGGTMFTASYYTPLNVTPGTLTAAFVGKNGTATMQGRCALAGADFVTVPQNQAVVLTQTQTISTAGGCVASFQVDPTSNKVLPNTIKLISGSTTDCSTSETTSMTVDNKNLVDIAAGQWTELGSCSFCFVNTYGGKTCTTCTSCTLRNGVCTK